MTNTATVFTIGHSAHPFDTFHTLLAAHAITAVADVRSAPYSRHAPQYCKDALQRALGDAGISYVFLGQQLGARTNDEACYEGDKVSYQRLAQTRTFRDGIKRVLDGAGRYRIALMCAERDPVDCHRTILVAKALTERGVGIVHILSTGETEAHEQTMLRVADLVGLPRKDLLRSTEEIIAEAYVKRGAQVAYRRKD